MSASSGEESAAKEVLGSRVAAPQIGSSEQKRTDLFSVISSGIFDRTNAKCKAKTK